MSSKEDDHSEGKFGGKYDDDDDFDIGAKQTYSTPPPKIEITSIEIDPTGAVPISAPLELKIKFELDRDAVAAFWVVKFLVDSSHKRIIKILGETAVDDYPEGDSEMFFSVGGIDVSGIPESTLTNSGLLMASLMVDGEEVASVNMVVNVFSRGDQFLREILNPME